MSQELMLLGEAKSAVGQCCRLLGEQKTNEILRMIDEAQTQYCNQAESP